VSLARFRVVARLEMASQASVGTVVIDRGAGLFSVRPLRRKRVSTLPLADVAAMVVRGIIAAEIRDTRAAKRARRAR